MKRWIKITALSVAVLNLMMLFASLYPVSTGGLVYAGNDSPKLKAQPIGDDQPSMVPESCKKIKNCHGFWGCAWAVLKCAADIINS